MALKFFLCPLVKKLECLWPSLTFKGKVMYQPLKWYQVRYSTQVGSIFPTNVRLELKCLEGKNTLACLLVW